MREFRLLKWVSLQRIAKRICIQHLHAFILNVHLHAYWMESCIHTKNVFTENVNMHSYLNANSQSLKSLFNTTDVKLVHIGHSWIYTRLDSGQMSLHDWNGQPEKQSIFTHAIPIQVEMQHLLQPGFIVTNYSQ